MEHLSVTLVGVVLRNFQKVSVFKGYAFCRATQQLLTEPT